MLYMSGTRIFDSTGEHIESTSKRLHVLGHGQAPDGTYPILRATNNGYAEINLPLDNAGRLRTSNPVTLFNMMQTKSAVNGFHYHINTDISGTASNTPIPSNSMIKMTVDGTGSYITNSSKQKGIYSAGKSMLIKLTGTLDAGNNNCPTRLGYFDADEGVYFEYSGSVASECRVCLRKGGNTTSIAQSSWDNNFTVDWTKSQYFMIEFLWQGVGPIKFYLLRSGAYEVVHTIHNENIREDCYMKSGCLPVTYQIDGSDVTDASAAMNMICATVSSEGGWYSKGDAFSVDSGSLNLGVDTQDQNNHILSLRINPTSPIRYSKIIWHKYSVACESTDTFTFRLYLTPSQNDTGTTPLTGHVWSDVDGSYSCMQQSIIHIQDPDFSNSRCVHTQVATSQTSFDLGTIPGIDEFGCDIIGASSEILSLCVDPNSSSETFRIAMNWSEIL